MTRSYVVATVIQQDLWTNSAPRSEIHWPKWKWWLFQLGGDLKSLMWFLSLFSLSWIIQLSWSCVHQHEMTWNHVVYLYTPVLQISGFPQPLEPTQALGDLQRFWRDPLASNCAHQHPHLLFLLDKNPDPCSGQFQWRARSLGRELTDLTLPQGDLICCVSWGLCNTFLLRSSALLWPVLLS